MFKVFNEKRSKKGACSFSFMMMTHKKISIMILNLIDILFFGDVHAGDHVHQKQPGTRCSMLKRSKNTKVTIMNLVLIKTVF